MAHKTSWFTKPWFVMVCVVAGMLVLALLSRVASTERNPVSRDLIEQTDSLMRSSNKWAAQSEQDKNPVMALMHSCYAKAYALTIRQLMDDAQSSKTLRVNMRDHIRRLDDVQQKALRRMAEVAPKSMPEGEFAVRTGWLG